MNLMMKDHSSSALLHYSISYLGCATNFTLNLPLPALGSRDNKPLFGSAFEQSANLALFRLGLLDATRRKHGRQAVWFTSPSQLKEAGSYRHSLLPVRIQVGIRLKYNRKHHKQGPHSERLLKSVWVQTCSSDYCLHVCVGAVQITTNRTVGDGPQCHQDNKVGTLIEMDWSLEYNTISLYACW